MSRKLTIWVLTERGLTGTENQCLGIAEHLGGEITIKRIELKWPFSLWSPFLSFGEGPRMLAQNSDSIDPPFPDILIAGGRKAIGLARFLRQASNRKTFVCCVQDPKVSLEAFDLVAMPLHDRCDKTGLCAQNILVTKGAPNRITPDLLTSAHDKWAPLLRDLACPRMAVLIGGNSKTHHLGETEMHGIIARLQQIQTEKKASLMITVSRRTPPELVQKLVDAFPTPMAVVYTGGGENPYHGFLAWADYILCTNDSVSMISDAATTGKPIEILYLTGRSKRHDRFIRHLETLGVTRDKGGYVPWRDAQDVALKIQTLLSEQCRKSE